MDDLFEPVQGVLPAVIEDDKVRYDVQQSGEILAKLVSLGTHLLKWEWSDNSTHLDISGVTSAFFRRIIELLDSVGILVSTGAVDPAINQLRALFEAVLSFEFLLQKDTELRCYCYIVADLYLRRITFDNPETKGMIDEAQERIKEIDYWLTNPVLDTAKAIYLNKVTDKQGHIRLRQIKWYTMLEGLNDFKQLAKYLLIRE